MLADNAREDYFSEVGELDGGKGEAGPVSATDYWVHQIFKSVVEASPLWFFS